MSDILKNIHFSCRVSSVLNKNIKLFGKKYMFDDNEETCWNSDQGVPQWIQIDFNEEITFSSFQIQFQGGFVGSDCFITTWTDDSDLKSEPFYPENNNTVQTFKMSDTRTCKYLKLTFNSSEDTYGRIIIYKCSLLK